MKVRGLKELLQHIPDDSRVKFEAIPDSGAIALVFVLGSELQRVYFTDEYRGLSKKGGE